jgi:hypothetical protein
MNLLAIVVVLTATCGILVVAGGIYLLAKGAITLAATSAADALTIEFKKQIRVTTQVPGVAFFLIGLCFVALALHWATPKPFDPIDLRGEITGVDGPVSVIIRSEALHPPVFRDGVIDYHFYPDFSVLTLEVSAPGYDPMPVPVEIAHATLVNLGRIQLRKRIEEIRPQSDSIHAIDFKPPLVTDTGAAYGTPR